MRRKPTDRDSIPDARDGLTHPERVLLYCLQQLQRERGGRSVPTTQLYGRVVEQLDISVEDMQTLLQRLVGKDAGR